MPITCPKCQFDNPDNTQFCGKCGENLPQLKDDQVAFTKTMETPIEELTTGSAFAGRYQIIEELGKGGMGKVYKALDTKINEKIAIKLIRPEIAADKKTIERFSNELKFARKISHRNVGRMYHLEEEKDRHYITMEYVPGEDLKSMIRMSGQLGIGTAINITRQVCEGLDEAHRLGVIHRDLKPNNIIIDKEGNARIMDFGIARSLKSKGMTGVGVMIGTPEYMAPEQVDGKEVDQRTDIYALGIIMFEMLAGRLPFEGDTAFTIGVKQKSEKPEDPVKYNPRISEDLSRLILKCLEKDPGERYPNVREMLSALDKIEDAVPTTERPIPERKPLTSKEITVTIGVKKLFVPALIAVAIVVIAIVLWQILPRQQAIPSASEKPSLAIMYFKNNTGDSELDHWRHALADLLITDLYQSKYIDVLSGDRLFKILEELDQLEAQTYSSDVLQEVASQGGINHILIGNYTRAGDVFRLNISLQQAVSGKVIGSDSVEGTGEQSFYAMVDELTRTIKSHFNLSQEQLSSDIDRGVGEITTSNPEALKFYLEGRRYHLNAEYEESISAMEKAVAIDPEFAMAFRSMAQSYNNLSMMTESSQYMQRAFELSERLSDRERFQIMGDFYSDSARTYPQAIDAYTQLLELYPNVLNAWNNLGIRYGAIGEREKAIACYEEGIQRGDRSVVIFNNLADSYRAIRKYDKSEEILKRYLAEIGDHPFIHNNLALHYTDLGQLDLALEAAEKVYKLNPTHWHSYARKGQIYRFKGEYEKSAAEFQRLMAVKSPASAFRGSVGMVYLLGEQGKIKEANALESQMFEILQRVGQELWKARAYIGFAEFFNLINRPNVSLMRAEQSLAILQKSDYWSFQRQALFFKSLALIQMDDLAAAENVTNELKELIEAGLNRKHMARYYHLKGKIELKKKNFSRAIELFQQSLALEEYGPLTYSARYLDSLAKAYYQSGDLDLALLEYEKITRLTFGRESDGIFYAKSFYWLGIISEEQQNNAQAAEYYQEFLEIWKDADPEFAEIEDARQRLANLQ